MAHGRSITQGTLLAIGPSQVCLLVSMAAIFQKWPTESIDFNISACCSLRMIEFLVSIHACLGPMNAKEVVATIYLHEMCKNDARGGRGYTFIKINFDRFTAV